MGKKARFEEVDVETGISGDEKDTGSEDDERYLDAHGDRDEEDDYAGPKYGEKKETMNGGFAYDPEIDGSE